MNNTPINQYIPKLNICPSEETNLPNKVRVESIKYGDFFVEMKESPARRHYSKVYNELYKETGLPQILKPDLLFEDIQKSGLYGCFVNLTGSVILPNDSEELRHLFYFTGDKFALRHEIEHVKQTFSMVRLLGVDGYKQLLIDAQQTDKQKEFLKKNFAYDYYSKVERTLGRLAPCSEEGKKALKYVEATKKYVLPLNKLEELAKAKGIFNKVRAKLNWELAYRAYNNNLLETEANKAAKCFKPSQFKKTAIICGGVCLEIAERVAKLCKR